jgi:hypothetical protein
MYAELDEIRASIAELEDTDARQNAAFALAMGIYTNDAVAPLVMALVWRGRVADLKIANPVCQLPLATATALINSVIIGAFNEWHRDYMRRLAPAPERPANAV